jgi:hypothetical protein
VLWVLAESIGYLRKRHALAVVPIVALFVAGIADSTPRRIGDGGEYVAMALNMSRGAPPALSATELAAISERLAATPGFDDTSIQEPLVGRDGRQDFYHPWLYSLFAAPLVAVVDRFGGHLNYAFATLNLSLAVLLLWWLTRNGYPRAALALAAGPLLWWIDKAHTEVFLFAALAFAVLLLERHPLAAMLAGALAAAQNPAAAVVVLALFVPVLFARPRRVSLPGIAATFAILAVMPAYYLWHLGAVSPLSSTIVRDVPGFRAIVTPLIDLNLGLLPYAPVLVLFAAAGIARTFRATLFVCLAAAAALLVVFAMSGNINHGGTPGMSRYGVWLLALAVPLIADGCVHLELTRPALLRILVAVSVAYSAYMFRPAWSDRQGLSPNWLAQTVWTTWPAAENPVPEVFAERVSGRDGRAVVPVGTAGCEKVLIRGDGAEAWWPFPCLPRAVPAACGALDALCYVNDDAVSRAPKQPRFAWDGAVHHAWTVGKTARFEPILALLGASPQFMRLGGSGCRIVSGVAIEQPYVVQGSSGVAVWVRGLEKPIPHPALRVKVERPSTVRSFDAESMMPVADPASLTAGIHIVTVPRSADRLVVVTDAR